VCGRDGQSGKTGLQVMASISANRKTMPLLATMKSKKRAPIEIGQENAEYHSGIP
jgi:hypothetical protein